jgi:hypothetical protein
MEAGLTDASRLGRFGNAGTRSGLGDHRIDCHAKTKLASQIETFAAAKSKPSEQPKIESTKNDALNNDTPNSQPQQTGAVQLKPALQQEANADPSTASNNTVSAPPTMPVESFDSRWSALQKSETSVEFKDRWALGSQDLWSDRIFDADCRGTACQ